MVNIKSVNEIVLGFIDFLNVSLPNISTVPGSVCRDILIDLPASQIALLYDELGKISNLQSLRLVAGSDLDTLAQNFGATRKTSTKSSGTGLLTFASIPAVVGITSGSLITATNGATFSIQNGLTVDPAQSNFYKSIAVKYQNDLNFLGITDQYAIEVSVQATTAGTAGNVSKYSLNTTQIAGVSNTTNVFPFTGGADQEDDATFRNRVLAIFSGSNIGTTLGYKNLALSNPNVLDALIIGPGNPLMTRDGTVAVLNSDGTYTITSEGTGGKVDILVLGNTLTENTDTFIYLDKSNNNDPTNIKNNFILGQIPGDANKTITQKRIDDLASGNLPAQPVEEILEVTGTLSGGNFIPKTVDSFGRISGNYELIKDTGNYSGSAWGFDTFHWVSNQIIFNEDRVKSKFNGQDSTTFSDVIEIPNVQQNVSILSENSQVLTSDHSIIQLLHTPATNTTRVFNVNTGENYTIINQNFNGSSATNTTGQIQISGNTLPASSDVLQVDYTWIVSYDPYSDYDGKIINSNIRPSDDSIDWGISNAIRNERILFVANGSNTVFTGTSKLSVSSVFSANYFSFSRAAISLSNVPNFTARKQINLAAIDNPINSIESIVLSDTAEELYNTDQNDGIIINNRIAIGSSIKYNCIIILPTDTNAVIGDIASITYNQQDVFNIINSTGTFANNSITIPIANIPATGQIYLDVNYIAAVQDLLSVGITNMPVSRSGNGYILNDSVGSINTIDSNTIKRENQTIQLNGSSQPFITLSITSTSYTLQQNQVLSVIDLRTGLEIWNTDFPGSVSSDVNNNYVLTFTTGLNAPTVGDNVLVLYFADDILRAQPFTFANPIYKVDFQSLLFNFTTNNFYVPIQNFIPETGINFNIIDNTSGLSLGSGFDGYITGSGNAVLFSSSSFNFSNIDDLTGKSIRLINTVNINNKGTFGITSIVSANNINIGLPLSNFTPNQVSIIRLSDNKDLWTTAGTIDVVDNILNLPSSSVAVQGDKVAVLLFGNKPLHQSPTRLSITVSDQVVNTGIITAAGTTISQVAEVVFPAINNGLKQNALAAFKTFLGLTSNSSISSNNYIVRVVKLEKVSVSGGQVINTLATYDVFGTALLNNVLYPNEMIYNSSLENTEFVLPSTTNNITNAPIIGDNLKITFYFATDNDSENLYFTKNNTLYTNKKFVFLDQLYVSSGFNASQSTRLTISTFTQPATGSRYTAFYNYTAPKQNERILIGYNYNQLISNVSLTVESQRPITSDVLVKEAKQLLVDATLNIIVSSDYSSSTSIVLQNVQDIITATINTNKLGDMLNSSDLIAAAQAVSGVQRVRILYFNQDGIVGQVLTLTCNQNQYFVANNVIINTES